MVQTISAYWPHILALLSLVLGTVAAIHAAMTKEEVRSALGWVGVIVLSPIIGALVYAVAGINRIRRKTLNLQRENMGAMAAHSLAGFQVSDAAVEDRFGAALCAMKTLGDRVGRYALQSGNSVTPLKSGDAAYSAMLSAIDAAQRSVLLETYIFDRDPVGQRFVEALSAASRRGVEVRVLIDAVGARYSIPSIVGALHKEGVQAKVFNGNIVMGLRLPYANLRTHRKIMIVDGTIAFSGGMNIRAGFSEEFHGEAATRDTHFRIEGAIVADLFQTAYEDWRFSDGEALSGEAWTIAVPGAAPGSGLMARVVASGPDKSLETNHRTMLGAFSIAKRSVRIMSPYFLPDRELVSALVTAARRGVQIDIAVPSANNLKLVDLAMTAQFDQLLNHGCRIWRTAGIFNHSKLMTVDGTWAYVGSSNLDPRSLRLNFEVDVEVFDEAFTAQIDGRISEALESAVPVDLQALRSRPFVQRLVERVVWLGSPYL